MKISEYIENTVYFLYKLTSRYKIEQLNNNTFENLKDISLFKPTADAATIIDLEYLFEPSSLRNNIDPQLSEILSHIIIKSTETVHDFDFHKIQTLTASKSFGEGYTSYINGSWFDSVYAWGAGMYPEKNLKAENTEDWKRNISHIEGEGFFRATPIRITYYKFFDRYVASNSGGSHHAAMVVYQSLRDNLEYKREAKIDTIDINIEKVIKLQNYFYSFIVEYKDVSNKYTNYRIRTDFIYQLRDILNCPIYSLKPTHYYKYIEFIFIPKNNTSFNGKYIGEWLSNAERCGKIIFLDNYLKNPKAFHTEHYHHKIDRIFLGDPCREYR